MRLMWTSSWPPGRMSVRNMGFMERLTLALTLVINISTDTVETAVPGPPHSLRLSSVSSTDAVIQWQYNVSDPEVSHFDVILVALDHRSHSYGASPVVRYHYGVTGGDVDSVLSHSLDELIPDTLYRLFMIAANTDGMSNASSVITFRTPAAPLTVGSLQVDPIEVLIVSLVVVAWICAIVLFRRKWDKIRIIQPCEPRYRHQPKNLDTIKVVQRPTDSVIYKNYSKTISKNMQARETKRIERMNTMPNIKVSDVIPKSIEPTKKRTIEKRRTVPMIELDMPIDLPTLDRLNEEDSFTENDSTSDARSSVV